MDTDEAPRKHSTYEGTKLALHELWDISITLALLRKEGFQVSGNDAVDRILFRIARPVDVFKSHRDVRECTRLRIPAGRENNDLRLSSVENSGRIAINESRLSWIWRFLRAIGAYRNNIDKTLYTNYRSRHGQTTNFRVLLFVSD
jgi:hypothetical protein